MIFLSSQASLSSKKCKKNWRNWKKGIVSRLLKKRVTIWSFQETCIRHWWKRVTMAKTWHDYGNPNLGGLLHKQKRVTIYLNRATILGAVVAYLSWRLFWKQGLRILERESAICRPGDWRKGRFPPFFTSLCMF